MIVIATHTQYFNMMPGYGTGSQIADWLVLNNISYIFIKHSLYTGFQSRIEYYSKGRLKIVYYGLKFLPLPIRIIQDFVISYIVVFPYRGTISRYIGVDPVNGAIGVFLKSFGMIYRTIFYTADFAQQRFSNVILNKAYHLIDDFSVNRSDSNWCVSTRILSLRIRNGIPVSNLVLAPNVPLKVFKKKLVDRHTKYVFTIVSTLRYDYVDFPGILLSFVQVLKKHPGTRLQIVGSGHDENDIRSLVTQLGIKKYVKFLGRLSNPKVLSILKTSYVGLAIYSNSSAWTEYGDSMKVREYLACGLPVIMNNTCSTADDIANSDVGLVINNTDSSLKNAMIRIISDKQLYKKFCKNAHEYALTLLPDSLFRQEFLDN